MAENIPQTKYDVFMSFRKHINSFVDNKLERGEETWQSLVEAIKGSSISLIIFSPDHASSLGVYMNL